MHIVNKILQASSFLFHWNVNDNYFKVFWICFSLLQPLLLSVMMSVYQRKYDANAISSFRLSIRWLAGLFVRLHTQKKHDIQWHFHQRCVLTQPTAKLDFVCQNPKSTKTWEVQPVSFGSRSPTGQKKHFWLFLLNEFTKKSPTYVIWHLLWMKKQTLVVTFWLF